MEKIKIKVKLAPRWISPFGAAQNGKNIDLIKIRSRNKNNANSNVQLHRDRNNCRLGYCFLFFSF